jgi:hypothetical protein
MSGSWPNRPSPNDAAKREEDAYHVSAVIETALRLGANQPWDPLLWEFISRSLSIRDDINPNPGLCVVSESRSKL